MKKNLNDQNMEIATFAAGCFWCVEVIYQNILGVSQVISGYSGGNLENPNYEEVISGKTGHAEAIQVIYNSKITTYFELLEVFWRIHNPTQLNRQGNDVGSQYRSIIFYHNDYQKNLALKSKKLVKESKIWGKDSIVTEIISFSKFYKAEDYHQEYYDRNPNNPYCYNVIQPKLEKFKKLFAEKLK